MSKKETIVFAVSMLIILVLIGSLIYGHCTGQINLNHV